MSVRLPAVARLRHLGRPMGGELIAEAYHRLSLLDDIERRGPTPSRYRAPQFRQGGRLELRNGYALGPEIVLRAAADRTQTA
jgi:hypothetical protein